MDWDARERLVFLLALAVVAVALGVIAAGLSVTVRAKEQPRLHGLARQTALSFLSILVAGGFAQYLCWLWLPDDIVLTVASLALWGSTLTLWLLFFLPVFLVTRPHTWVWRLPLGVLFGAIVGGTAAKLLWPEYGANPMVWQLGAAVGGSYFLVGALLKRLAGRTLVAGERRPRRPERAHAPGEPTPPPPGQRTPRRRPEPPNPPPPPEPDEPTPEL